MIPVQAKQLIDAINAADKKHGKYDQNFINSVTEQIAANKMLTEKQSNYLQALYRKVYGG